MSKYNKPYYNSWRCMLSRCYRENDPSYNHYGGRGIKVCDEWHDFDTFEKWVLTSNYEQGLTIDRINCDEDYSPANCQWADKKTQANNKTNTYHITHNGETHTVSEWAEITGINRKTLSGRVWRGPAADVVEVRRGRWEKVDDNPYEYVAVCSVCHNEVKQPTCMLKPIYSYCPICGARMDGEEK